MKKFRTLQLAIELNHKCNKLKVSPIMRNQMDRAALSVVANICEGAGRITKKDKARIYSIALGSLREVQGFLLIIDNKVLMQEANILCAHLIKLIRNPGFFK